MTIRQEGVGMRSFAAYTVELIEDCRRKGSQSETRVITPVQQPIILLPAPGSLPRASYGLRMTIIIRCTYTVAHSGQPLPRSQHNNSPNSVNCTELKSNYAYYRVIAKNVGDPFLWDTVYKAFTVYWKIKPASASYTEVYAYAEICVQNGTSRAAR